MLLDLGVIVILAELYRRRARLRLEDLELWIQEWAPDEMHAGIPSVGAEDAWYTTAVVKEYFRCSGIDITGGAADIWKCFDQIVRPLVYSILRIAWFPHATAESLSEWVG